MVLEATMIIVDNSESSRNGDYLPSRFGAQAEAVSMIFNAKTAANPESAVGLISMGGPSPTVLVTPTTDIGAILGGLHATKIKGESHLSTALSIAALALKHRQNKSQRQRIVCFNCSEIHDEEKELVKLAKKMKKNNISVDFIAFGDLESDTKGKLEKFNENVTGGDGSYLAVVPPGPNLLSDGIVATPIVGGEPRAEGDFGDGEGGRGGGGFEFGIDPSTDPELAMALRMSMEEEENRLARERREREAQEASRMEAIPEEGQSTSAAATNGESETKSHQPTVEDEKKDGDGDDQMDTA
jgi:26S proteasome regulatory subunit N10